VPENNKRASLLQIFYSISHLLCKGLDESTKKFQKRRFYFFRSGPFQSAKEQGLLGGNRKWIRQKIKRGWKLWRKRVVTDENRIKLFFLRRRRKKKK